MADNTKIEWTEATWNPVTGCTVCSPGCTNCYAMKLAGTRLQHIPSRAGLTRPSKAGPVWTGEVRFNEQWLDQPLRWKRPRMIFVCAHGDLFHESVPDEWIDRVFAVMALAPQHTFQVLTKRSARMREYMTGADIADPLLDGRLQHIQSSAYRLAATRSGKWDEAAGMAARQACIDALHRFDDRTNAGFRNVWLGVSVEDQTRADERIPDLLATPAAVRWISAEPLLGPVDLRFVNRWACDRCGYFGECSPDGLHLRRPGYFCTTMAKPWKRLDWVVAGGESGPGARPMHPDWARSLREQCAEAGVPFFFKQWGEWLDHETALDVVGQDSPLVGDGRGRMRSGQDGLAVIGGTTMIRIGKAHAGRLLDRIEHNAMPGGAA